MTCYHPINIYRTSKRTASGKSVMVFRPRAGLDIVASEKIPCGQCIGCRLRRSAEWAMRCVHEARLYDRNCFITLTYDDEHLPADHGLCLDHYQKFMKRLRKAHGRIRFYHCGEYGEQNRRPHYHACLFGFDFADKELFSEKNDIRLYTSDDLDALWGKGYALIGDVTFESAAYVARYCLKKVNGQRMAKAARYMRICDVTGEVWYVAPEYSTMSRRPGIGAGWYDRYALTDVYPHDRVVLRGGAELPPPRFYDTRYEITHPVEMEFIRARRQKKMQNCLDDTTKRRLNDREAVKTAEMRQVPRSL